MVSGGNRVGLSIYVVPGAAELNAYPVHGKAKSHDICAAFIQGAPKDAKGEVFYGVDSSNLQHWQRCRASGEPYYYCDNAYFDKTRGTHFRITQGAIQHSGQGQSDGKRFKSLALQIKPWRSDGDHIVVCPQSDSFMRDLADWNGNWLDDVVRTLALVSNRRFKVRNWHRDKSVLMATLNEDLRNAWILVTHSSAAAVNALLEGIPVACNEGAAKSMGVQALDIEDPVYPEDRERFFMVLADNQWTLDEIKRGVAWKALARGSS